MYCSKCGAQNDDAASFCSKCGNGLNKETAISVAPIQAFNAEAKPKKKKSKKLPVILAAVVVVIVIIAIAAGGGEGGIDYVATVKAHAPFGVQGLPGITYGQVFDRFITSPSWKAVTSGEVTTVTMRGIAASSASQEVVVVISVKPNPDNPDKVLITPTSVAFTGQGKSANQNEAVEALIDIFRCYDDGDDNLLMFFLFSPLFD